MATAARSGGLQVEQHIRTARKFDFWLILSSMALLGIGLMSLYSQQMAGSAWFKKQLVNVAIGTIPFGIMLLVHPRVWQRYASVLYGINLTLLGVVLFMGKTSKGAQRWIDIGPTQFQPSELAKLLIIFTLAA